MNITPVINVNYAYIKSNRENSSTQNLNLIANKTLLAQDKVSFTSESTFFSELSKPVVNSVEEAIEYLKHPDLKSGAYILVKKSLFSNERHYVFRQLNEIFPNSPFFDRNNLAGGKEIIFKKPLHDYSIGETSGQARLGFTPSDVKSLLGTKVEKATAVVGEGTQSLSLPPNRKLRTLAIEKCGGAVPPTPIRDEVILKEFTASDQPNSFFDATKLLLRVIGIDDMKIKRDYLDEVHGHV